MTTDNYALSCLVGIMDHLWFHQVMLCSKILQPTSMSAASEYEQLLWNHSSTNNDSETQFISEDNSSSIISNQEQDSDDEEERPGRLNLAGNKTPRHHSSSPPSSLKRRSCVYPRPRADRRLNKTMSCKSLCELELEEVKGFMDLGFTFDKQHLSKRMMSVIPGLQRLELGRGTTDSDDDAHKSTTDEDDEDDVEGEVKLQRRPVTRPYLSEAWMIKRADSPLLNLRIPRVSTAADMKKHLKYWAKTVASAIQLES